MTLILVPILVAMLVAPTEQTPGYTPGHRQEDSHDDFKKAYSSINEYLVDKIDASDSMASNMDALSARLHAGEKNRAIGKVLQNLIAMRDTEGKCNRISYEVLRENDNATAHKSYDVTSKRSAPRRIDKLINFYATQHAKTCQPMTVAAFEKSIATLDKQVFERVSNYLEPIVNRLLADQTTAEQVGGDDVPNKLFRGIIMSATLNQAIVQDVPHAYDTILKSIKNVPSEERLAHLYSDERTGKRVFLADEFLKLFAKYLEQPCADYVGHLGELFDNASFDAIFYHQVDSNNVEFYQAWAYAKLCMNVVKPEKKWEFKRKFDNYAYLIAKKEDA